MKMRNKLRICKLMLFLVALLAQSQTTPVTGKPTESVHQKGPDGLEGWTLDYAVPGLTGTYSEALVIARKGHIIRKIDGTPFIWSWKFFNDGRQVGYETGPLHFGMSCILLDISTAKTLAVYDCYYEQPKPEPPWVVELESQH